MKKEVKNTYKEDFLLLYTSIFETKNLLYTRFLLLYLRECCFFPQFSNKNKQSVGQNCASFHKRYGHGKHPLHRNGRISEHPPIRQVVQELYTHVSSYWGVLGNPSCFFTEHHKKVSLYYVKEDISLLKKPKACIKKILCFKYRRIKK